MDDGTRPVRYAIRVRGLLSDTLLGAFPELHGRAWNHETALIGVLSDQAALHGVLNRIEALGLELLEVRRLKARPAISAEVDYPADAAAERSA